MAAEWYKLGIVLQVEMYVLNNITVNSVQQGVEKCCMDLFMRWLRGDKGTGSLPRTWDTIIPAVEEIDPPLARELHLIEQTRRYSLWLPCITITSHHRLQAV